MPKTPPMCNAYGLAHPLTALSQAFAEIERPLLFPAGAPNLGVREVRPTEAAPVVLAGPEGSARLESLGWGFASTRAGAGGRAGPPVINFRSEGRRFPNRAEGGRCLIPASWFYEFTDPEPPSHLGPTPTDAPLLDGAPAPPRRPKRALKTKWCFTLAEPDDPAAAAPTPSEGQGEALAALMAIAGLWRAGAEGEAGRFTMLTCAPGPDVAPIHDRQVVVVPRAAWPLWLDGEVEAAAALLRPSPAGTFAVTRMR